MAQNEPRQNAFFDKGSRSWTDMLPRTEHVDLFRNADYGATSLGPIEEWGPALRMYASLVFTDSRGACVYWGPRRVATYNEGFAVTAGGAHPRLMGKAFEDVFGEMWDQMRHVFDHAQTSSQTVDVDNILLFPVRRGFGEESYFIGQFIPLRGDSGEVEGFYNTVYESTNAVLHDRRRRIIENVAAIPPQPVEETLDLVIEALKENPNDVTMALLYSYVASDSEDVPDLQLRGSIGVPEGHPCAPKTARLETDQHGLLPYFRQARETGATVVLSESDGSLEKCNGIFEAISWCGFGEPSRDIVVHPLMSSGTLLGFYVQGTNPRRLYDDIAQMSITDMARQIEAKWIASLTAEQAKQREEALERRATESENRLRHMALQAPIAMLQIATDGRIQWANDQFYQMTGHDRTKPHVEDFWERMNADDVKTAQQLLAGLLAKPDHEVREFRLRRTWTPPIEGAEDEPIWVLSVNFPFMENGAVKFVMCYLLDISQQKWAESVQSRNVAAALQAKAQQEEFIDVTSHEMRNPLTAMMQLADGIARSLTLNPTSIEQFRAVVEDNIEAAQTILACAAHQKRVIDDVLILSRLESEMLSITPVSQRPSRVVDDILKMFSGEVAMNGTSIKPVRDPSYDALQMDYVLLDTSRLAQVLINLLSNAIKFTASRDVRKITVSYGAARQPPGIKTTFGDVEWVKPSGSSHSAILPPLANGEEELYLWFCVQDTGPGMTPQEMQRLFKRFSQASSRTHIEYGGCGIGLYICRQLAEKQGGQVGVASLKGEGAAFGFYIETRRADELNGLTAQAARLSIDSGDIRLPEPAEMNELAVLSKVVDDEGPSKQPPPALPRTESESERQRGKHHVLLCEDNLINQRILAKQLRASGCSVTVANHGQEALDVLQRSDWWCSKSDGDIAAIDIVLLDWEMPIMNGLQACRRIRELEISGKAHRRLPVVAITANVRQAQIEQAMAAGMDSVLPKPFTVTELLDRIEQLTKGVAAAA